MTPVDINKIYEMREVTTAPQPVFRVPPKYPRELRAAGITGEAVVEAVIDQNGQVMSVKVVSSSEPRFGEAAAAAEAL